MKSDLVRGARDVEPLLAAHLVIANHSTHARIENFCASAGQGVHSRAFECEQRIADGKLGDAREIADLDHGESLQMHARTAGFQPSNQVEKIVEREIGVQAADQMKFRGAFTQTLFGALPDFFQGKCVGAGSVRAAAESAELAMRHADVRWVDVPVNVEVANVAVALFADVVRQPAQGQQIGRAINGDAVLEAEPFAGQNFGGDGFEARIVDYRNSGHSNKAHEVTASIRVLSLLAPCRQRLERPQVPTAQNAAAP